MLDSIENQNYGDEFGVEIEKLSANIEEDVPHRIISALKNVYDPDISYNIYDMGLIYKITISETEIKILMTLTSINCPAAQSLPDDVYEKVKFEFPNHEISVDITFTPQWTIDNLAEYVKIGLRLI